MADKGEERRKYERYNTAVNIYFDYASDLATKVKFRVIDQKKKTSTKKYSAFSQNISVEGICFSSSKKVEQEDLLELEVYLPDAKKPILMTGEVRWCKPLSKDVPKGKRGQRTYLVGMQLMLVDGKSVRESIHYDKEYDVKWSIVMESVFGDYKMLMGGKYRTQSEQESVE